MAREPSAQHDTPGRPGLLVWGGAGRVLISEGAQSPTLLPRASCGHLRPLHTPALPHLSSGKPPRGGALRDQVRPLGDLQRVLLTSGSALPTWFQSASHCLGWTLLWLHEEVEGGV